MVLSFQALDSSQRQAGLGFSEELQIRVEGVLEGLVQEVCCTWRCLIPESDVPNVSFPGPLKQRMSNTVFMERSKLESFNGSFSTPVGPPFSTKSDSDAAIIWQWHSGKYPR